LPPWPEADSQNFTDNVGAPDSVCVIKDDGTHAFYMLAADGTQSNRRLKGHDFITPSADPSEKKKRTREETPESEAE